MNCATGVTQALFKLRRSKLRLCGLPGMGDAKIASEDFTDLQNLKREKTLHRAFIRVVFAVCLWMASVGAKAQSATPPQSTPVPQPATPPPSLIHEELPATPNSPDDASAANPPTTPQTQLTPAC